jgi:hypothetical protein
VPWLVHRTIGIRGELRDERHSRGGRYGNSSSLAKFNDDISRRFGRRVRRGRPGRDAPHALYTTADSPSPALRAFALALVGAGHDATHFPGFCPASTQFLP